MRHRYIFASTILFACYFLLYHLGIRSPPGIQPQSIGKNTRHNAIILTKEPTTKVLKHLNTLVKVGVNAYLMCDENPSAYTKILERILYVDDQGLAQYGLTRNRVWDRVFLWLYNQTSIDYVWLMEDDLTWTDVQHMLNLFNKYANNPADLLARKLIPRNDENVGWIWWPKSHLKLIPEHKWMGSLNMLSRVFRRLVLAHQYYVRQLWEERKKNTTMNIDENYYYQEFFTPTVAQLFNLTAMMYNHSNMDVYVFRLSEDDIQKSLKDGKQIFHPVKHESSLLSNATL